MSPIRPNISAILDEIAPVADLPKYAKLLIYGSSGVGKTVLAATAFEHPLYIDSLEGWVSLSNHPDLEARVHRLPYKGISQLELLADYWDREFAGKYDGIILDEASTMADTDLDTVLASRSSKNSEKDPDVPTQPDFFANTNRMKKTFRRILTLPVDVCLVAHSRKDEDAGRKLISPDFSPKLGKTIKEYLHLVGYLTTIEKGSVTQRQLQVTPTQKIDAKTRIGGLPSVIVDPDLGKILANWRLMEPEAEITTNQIPRHETSESVTTEDMLNV